MFPFFPVFSYQFYPPTAKQQSPKFTSKCTSLPTLSLPSHTPPYPKSSPTLPLIFISIFTPPLTSFFYLTFISQPITPHSHPLTPIQIPSYSPKHTLYILPFRTSKKISDNFQNKPL